MSPEEAHQLALDITRYLFTNGDGQRAEQLALMLSKGAYGGGWSFQAVHVAITRFLTGEASDE